MSWVQTGVVEEEIGEPSAPKVKAKHVLLLWNQAAPRLLPRISFDCDAAG